MTWCSEPASPWHVAQDSGWAADVTETPCGPAGPAAPADPAGPAGPVGPADPAGPAEPAGPVSPEVSVLVTVIPIAIMAIIIPTTAKYIEFLSLIVVDLLLRFNIKILPIL